MAEDDPDDSPDEPGTDIPTTVNSQQNKKISGKASSTVFVRWTYLKLSARDKPHTASSRDRTWRKLQEKKAGGEKNGREGILLWMEELHVDHTRKGGSLSPPRQAWHHIVNTFYYGSAPRKLQLHFPFPALLPSSPAFRTPCNKFKAMADRYSFSLTTFSPRYEWSCPSVAVG